MIKTVFKVRMAAGDAHYAGCLVDGAKLLELFGDAATEMLVRLDGDEGLFRAYDGVDFLAPVHAGDFIEIRGRIDKIGNTSRHMVFEAWKVIEPLPQYGETAAGVLEKPVLVCKASGTCITPKEKQRIQP